MDKVEIELENFKYPTKEEYVEADKGFPDIKNFEFEYVDQIKLILSDKAPFEIVSREGNLYWWNICL